MRSGTATPRRCSEPVIKLTKSRNTHPTAMRQVVLLFKVILQRVTTAWACLAQRPDAVAAAVVRDVAAPEECDAREVARVLVHTLRPRLPILPRIADLTVRAQTHQTSLKAKKKSNWGWQGRFQTLPGMPAAWCAGAQEVRAPRAVLHTRLAVLLVTLNALCMASHGGGSSRFYPVMYLVLCPSTHLLRRPCILDEPGQS